MARVELRSGCASKGDHLRSSSLGLPRVDARHIRESGTARRVRPPLLNTGLDCDPPKTDRLFATGGSAAQQRCSPPHTNSTHQQADVVTRPLRGAPGSRLSTGPLGGKPWPCWAVCGNRNRVGEHRAHPVTGSPRRHTTANLSPLVRTVGRDKVQSFARLTLPVSR